MIIYKVKEQVINDISGWKPKDRYAVLIVESDEANPLVWKPSPLTEFLEVYMSEKAVNTKIHYGYVICDFLNYLKLQIELGEDECFDILQEEGIYGLNFIHASKYLTYIGTRKTKVNKQGEEELVVNNYSTVKRKENILISFYTFLNKKKILTNKDAIVEHKVVPIKNRGNVTSKGKRVSISPFKDSLEYKVFYPPTNPTNSYGESIKAIKLADMKRATWELFLEYARENYPDIALGVAMQFMGGLRLGEVVNLTIDAVEVNRDKDKLFLDINDRQLFLFKSLKSKKSQVKFARENQVVFNWNQELFNIWDEHMKYLSKLKKRTNIKALFVNKKGNPMTGDVYEERFKKLKSDFIEFLENSKPVESKTLKKYAWSTHIGRHVFTNFIIKTGLANNSMGVPDAKIVASLRGDRNLSSALAYIDSIAMVEAIDENLQNLSKEALKEERV